MRMEIIFYPALVLVGHTFLVWCWMYVNRFHAIRKHGIPLRAFKDRRSAAETRGATGTASDNFKNLFELPMLFYFATLVVFVTHNVSPWVLWLSWAYVFSRIIHSLIHMTYNKVLHRFFSYIAGSALLWALWVVIALRLLGRT